MNIAKMNVKEHYNQGQISMTKKKFPDIQVTLLFIKSQLCINHTT